MATEQEWDEAPYWTCPRCAEESAAHCRKCACPMQAHAFGHPLIGRRVNVARRAIDDTRRQDVVEAVVLAVHWEDVHGWRFLIETRVGALHSVGMKHITFAEPTLN